MSRYYLLAVPGWLLLFFLAKNATGQALPLRELGSLPPELYESSGLVARDSADFWSHNDSGNDPILYRVDRSGQVVRRVRVVGASNLDWEAITDDRRGKFFLGDFGNNGSSRRDLAIFEIPYPTSDTAFGQQIAFTFSDQKAFPPPPAGERFDLEAMVWLDDSLHLFTKNRTQPFNGFVYHYRLPAQSGTYIAQKIDSTFLGPGPRELYWVSDASVSPSGDRLVMVSTDRLFLFQCYSASDFFGGVKWELPLGFASQKEAIAFIDENRIAVTDERLLIFGGKLYAGNLAPYRDSLPLDLGGDRQLAPGDSVRIGLREPVAGATYRWNTGETGPELSVNQPGTYVLEMRVGACRGRDTVRVERLTRVDQNGLPPISLRAAWVGNVLSFEADLPTADPVELRILDAKGALVAKFRYPISRPGNQRFRFSPQSLYLPTGTYIAVLRQGSRGGRLRFVR